MRSERDVVSLETAVSIAWSGGSCVGDPEDVPPLVPHSLPLGLGTLAMKGLSRSSRPSGVGRLASSSLRCRYCRRRTIELKEILRPLRSEYCGLDNSSIHFSICVQISFRLSQKCVWITYKTTTYNLILQKRVLRCRLTSLKQGLGFLICSNIAHRTQAW